MTEDQSVQLLVKLDTLIQNTSDILAIVQNMSLTLLFLCGLMLAGFLCVIFFGGLK